MTPRGWVLSRRWQLSVQLVCGVLASSLFTVIRPAHFSQSCLAPVFAVIIIASLAQDQHIGSRLQVTALLLGPTWLAVLLAGSMMTLAKLAEDPHDPWNPRYIAAVLLLSLVGLAVLVVARAAAPPGPPRIMGVIAALMYGIITLVGVARPGLVTFWESTVASVVLSLVVGSVVALLVGLLVAPSLASDEVAALTCEALRGAGAIISYHTSLLMADKEQHTANSSNEAKDSSKALAGVTANLHVKIRSGPEDDQTLEHSHPQQEYGSAVPGKGHRQQTQQHSRPAQHQPHTSQHHQHHGSDTSSVVDAVTAAVAVHRAALQQQHYHGTLDWVQDAEQDTAAPAVAAVGQNPLMLAANSSVGLPRGKSSGKGHVQAGSSSTTHSDGHSIPSTKSEHSAGEAYRDTDLDVASWAVLQSDRLMQQQASQDTQQTDSTASANQPKLTEQLLQDASLSPSGVDVTAAWVAAAAAVTASRQGSMVPAASLESLDSLGLFAAAAEGSSGVPCRRNLEHAASLEFQSEMDDKAFLEMMRTLSRSKPYGSTASLDKLGHNNSSKTPQQQQQEAPSGPAFSAASTAGSVLGHSSFTKGVGTPKHNSGQQTAGLSLSSSSWARHLSNARDADAAAALDSDHDGELAGRLRSPRLSSYLRSFSAGSLWLWSPQRRQGSRQQPPMQNEPPAGPPALVESQLADHKLTLPVAGQSNSLGHHVHFAPSAAGSDAAHDHDPFTSQPELMAWDHRRNISQVDPAISTSGIDNSNTPRQQAPPATAAQLGPIIAAAKVALASARFEPSWLRPRGYADFNVDAWATLLEDAELLLVRVSTLEALSEERQLQGLHLHDLEHYNNMADAVAITLAQLAAFLADVSAALQRQQTNRHVSDRLAACCGWSTTQDSRKLKKERRQQQQQALAKSAPNKQQQPQQAVQQAASPFSAAAVDQVVSGSQQRQADWVELGSAGRAASLSAILSGMERQGSGVSSYLWEKKTGWETGRHLLQHEMEAAVGAYWWAVRKASKAAPVKVPRSREVMTLTFVLPICNGLIDASERLEATAQRVLRGQQQIHSKINCNGRGHVQQGTMQPASAVSAVSGKLMASAAASLVRWRWRLASTWRGAVEREQQWLQPLVRVLLVQPGLHAVKQALLVDLPIAMHSKQGFLRLLKSRMFQAGFKLFIAAGSCLIATVLLMVGDTRVRQVAPIFGFTSVCLSMQERVEATTEKVVGRVLGTIVGASLGLGINHIPGIFNSPLLMLVCLGLACIPLSMIARAQARNSVALAILTLLSVALCLFETTCYVPGTHLAVLDVFLIRMGAVVGACVYVAILNRLLLPWYTSSYALEQMADALDQTASLFERIYASQHNRMRLAAVAAGALLADDDSSSAAAVVSVGAGELPKLQHQHETRQQHQVSTQCSSHSTAGLVHGTTAAAATAELATLEAAEAGLHVALRQEVLSRLIAVQMSLAKESVSWKRGVLATPQVVLDVLGAMIECVEALASQRLALAPFTRQGQAGDAGGDGGHGLLRLSGHCYSVWAAPLHPCWHKTLTAVRELAQETAQQLRQLPAGDGIGIGTAAAAALDAKLAHLEQCRLDLRSIWLGIRRELHKQVHDKKHPQLGLPNDSSPTGRGLTQHGTVFWPTDSIHFFTFTYGASRVLNKLTSVTRAALSAHANAEAPRLKPSPV